MPSIATTRIWSLSASGVARFVRACHFAPSTNTVPSGFTAPTATPTVPRRFSRPIVGVAKRVRTIEGIPTMNDNATLMMHTESDSQPGRIVIPSTSLNMVNAPMMYDTRPTPVQTRGTPTCTSTANATNAAKRNAMPTPLIDRAPIPMHPSIRHTAPTKAAIPMPAVKNSKSNNASPIVTRRSADGGLATVCNKRGIRPSLKKRTVVASRVTCPFASNASDTVSRVIERMLSPSSAYNMLRKTGTPRSSVENFRTFCSRASRKPREPACNFSSAAPNVT